MQELIRMAKNFFKTEERFRNHKCSILIGISKLRSFTQEYESFDDIKESLQKSGLTKDLESCFLTFDPLDEPLVGGLKKEEFVRKIDELLPVTRGENIFDIDSSNEEKAKLKEIGEKFQSIFEKELNDFNNKENIVEIKQYLFIVKFLNKIGDDGWQTNYSKIQFLQRKRTK